MDSKELRSLMEAYQQVCAPQEETVELDEGLRSAVKRLLGKKEAPAEKKPESRGEYLRRRYNVGPDKSDTSAKRQILNRSRARAERDERDYGGSKYSKSVAKKSADVHDRYLRAGYSKYGADLKHGSGNKARRRAAALQNNEFEWLVSSLIDEGYDLSTYTVEEFYDFCCEEFEQLDEGLRDKVGEKVKKHVNQYAYQQGIHNNPGWLRKPEKRAALNKAVRDDIKKNPKAAVQYVASQVKRKLRGEEFEYDVFDTILEFLIDEEIAQDIQEATWIMSNVLSEEQIDEILGMFGKKKKPNTNRGLATEFAGRSMEPEKKSSGYEVDTRAPEKQVTTYGKGGKTDTFKTRGRV